MSREPISRILQLVAALTIATMPVLIASGNRFHTSMTAAKSGFT